VARKTEVPITGSVLTWARTEAGLSLADLAKRAGVETDTVRAWESGDGRPGKTVFAKVVEAVRRPSAIFFMPAPPQQAGLPTNLRRAPGPTGKQLSVGALREVRKARRIQRALGWLLAEEEAPKVDLPMFIWDSVDATAAGAHVRDLIGLTLAEQASWKDAGVALREWRGVFDQLGILVFSLQLGTDEIRGFSAWDDRAPLVAVNTSYIPAARIYTLAHELGHLVTRTDSACYDWVSPSGSGDVRLERWCEEFASSFLLPRTALLGYLAHAFAISEKTQVADFDTVWKLSRKLKVSARAMALALIKNGLAPRRLYDIVDEQAKKVDRPTSTTGGGGQPTVEKRIGQYGPRASRTLIDAEQGGRLSVRDVADYLDVNLAQLDDLRLALGSSAPPRPVVA
jgi:Zn-dependent peptidase ImmA (M78 family)/transcriptional regulator with XRE-family HTH domain